MVQPSPSQFLSAYTTTTIAVRNRVLAFVRAAWGGLEAWHEADIDRFVRRVVPVVTGGQIQIAALTDGYLAAMASVVLGTPTRPVGIPARLVNDSTMRGVSAADVYRRMGPTVWTALSNGHGIDDAVSQGLTRALVVAATDLQLAKTHSTKYALSRNDKAVGFERVPDGEACDFCLLASTQRYRVDDLMPLHDRCACDVAPLFEERGRVIHEELRAELEEKGVVINRGDGEKSFYGKVGDRDVGVTVHQHGELGPVLTRAGDHFTSEADF